MRVVTLVHISFKPITNIIYCPCSNAHGMDMERVPKFCLRNLRIFCFSGTLIQILSPRKLDNSDAGFAKWKFMSVATWGEDPRGTWTLDIFDEVRLKSILKLLPDHATTNLLFPNVFII